MNKQIDSLRSFFSHRAHRVHGVFWRTFRAHRTPSAYREHRAFLLKLAVMFCEFCRPQGLCEMLSILFICVILWEKVRTLAMRWHPSKSLGCIISHRTHRFNRAFLAHAFVHWKFFLSQSTQSSRSFFAHSFEPTERLRHTEVTEAFQLTLAVTLCEIGWLNVSVECCVFCSSVFFCEK